MVMMVVMVVVVVVRVEDPTVLQLTEYIEKNKNYKCLCKPLSTMLIRVEKCTFLILC